MTQENITSKNGNNKIWWIVGAVTIVVIMWGISTYNNLVRMQGAVDNAWAQVENNLKRRYDLIPNLVSTVKGYANHEEEVFTQIAEARSKLNGATTVEDKAAASNQLEAGLGRLLAISESYPELKADQSFLSLQDELAGTENRLAVSRKDYNDTTTSYNIRIRTFPTNLIAGLMGAGQRDLFTISQTEAQNVVVSFD